MIETVLFDCWGTLLQAPNLMRRGASVKLFYRSLTANGCDIDLDAFRDAYIVKARRPHEEAREDFRELDYMRRIDSTLRAIGFQHPMRASLVRRAWTDYLAEWPKQSSFYEETPMLLDLIKGRYKLGLVTNFPDGPTAREVFTKFSFETVFDSLVVSGEVGFRKPNRIIFERALGELGSAAASAVMVGDTFDADIAGARAMGMRTIFIDSDGSQAENYALPDAVIRSIGEALRLL